MKSLLKTHDEFETIMGKEYEENLILIIPKVYKQIQTQIKMFKLDLETDAI